MEKTKEILIKLYLNFSENEFSNFGDDLFNQSDLRSAICEVLDNQEIFIIDLAVYINQIKKKIDYEEDDKAYMKKLRSLWDSFSVNDLYDLKDKCDNNSIKNIIQKMIILKNAFKKFNQEVVDIDYEDYFYEQNKLINLIL
jgi:hypothetical protein